MSDTLRRGQHQLGQRAGGHRQVVRVVEQPIEQVWSRLTQTEGIEAFLGQGATLVAIPAAEKIKKDDKAKETSDESKDTKSPVTSKVAAVRPKHTWCYPRQTAKRVSNVLFLF